MKNDKKDSYPLTIVYIILILVMFILPFFSLDVYTIQKNTTSHLGAQNTPNAWIMNLVFIALGITTIIGGWRFLGRYLFHKIVLGLFGASLVLVAIYQHAPIAPNITFDIGEDELHSIFAKTTGWTFTLFAVATGFITKNKTQLALALGIGILATVLSLLMFYPPTASFMGIWQRMIFISAFGWLIYAFQNYELKEI